jgi:hypothetical protein
MVLLYDKSVCVRVCRFRAEYSLLFATSKLEMDHSYGRDSVEPAVCTLVGGSEAAGQGLMTRSQHCADVSRGPGGYYATDNDGFVAETFTLPLEAARRKVRDICDRVPQRGYLEIVERWRQLPDGNIEFTMRRMLTSD